MSVSPVPFSRPFRTPAELTNLEAVLASGHVHGDGDFTRSASARLRDIIPGGPALLTSSGTHALEMASLLLRLEPGDEVILPSFTFPSAATAIALTGATPVFVDIDGTTGNIDPASAEAAVTSRTKAISVMHYGGVGVDLAAIDAIAAAHGLPIIEDNAHGLGASRDGQSLGAWGRLAIQSFHDTKNIHSGEGGALFVNDPDLVERAEIIREKGTNRSRFLRGQVDKYTWTDIGSSFLMSELSAAVLDSQLADFESIQARRRHVWDRYATELVPWALEREFDIMPIPEGAEHPSHLFFMLAPTLEARDRLLVHLRGLGVIATFHYVPLDSSPAGLEYGRTPVPCTVSADFSGRLIRLPLWAGMDDATIDRVLDAVSSFADTPAV